MNICESLVVTAQQRPNDVALLFNGQALTYSELDALSCVTAERLAASGVQPGDRVALMLPNTPGFVAWYYGALRIGAVVASVSTRLADAEVKYVLKDSGAKALVATGEKAVETEQPLTVIVDDFERLEDGVRNSIGIAAEFDRSVFEAAPDSAALILYTSGTTGFPKGATLSHGNVRSNVAAFNHLCNMRPRDVILLAVPLFHCFGQNALLNSALNVGATLVLQEKFDLNETKQLIGTHKVTQLYGVPMMFGLLHDSCEPADLASVNYCFSAAATLPIQISRDWLTKFNLPIHEGYGLTETSPFASYNHRDQFKLGSIGVPIDAVEMKVVDTETGETCATGELGELAIRGPNVMLGYWNRPDDTAKAIRDGWFYSGDIGRVDDEGYFYIVDRVKDMITVGGLKVFPAEVERVLLDHHTVAQAAVVGVPDPVFGEQVVAYVVPTENANAADSEGDLDANIVASVTAHAKANLGNYKVPRQVILIDELPRNPSGKVLKTELRERSEREPLSAADEKVTTRPGESDSARLAKPIPHVSAMSLNPPTLRQDLARVHNSERIRVATLFITDLVQQVCDLPDKPDPDTRFLDAGLDSLAIVEMSARLQTEIGSEVQLPATLVFDCPRIVDLASFVVKTLDGSATQALEESPMESPPAPMLLAQQVQAMSEEEALTELMKELE